MRLVSLLGSGLLLLQGCLYLYGFTEADDGDSSKFLSGRTFTVSLPACDQERVPQISKGAIVRFMGSRKEDHGSRDIFEFRADVAGETQILISKTGNPEGPFYTFTAKVTLGGQPY